MKKTNHQTIRRPNHQTPKSSAGAFRPLRCLLIAFVAFAAIFTLADLAFIHGGAILEKIVAICEKGVATDMYSLAGDDDSFIAQLAKKTAGEIRVLCTDNESAKKCREAFPYFREQPDPSQLLEFFGSHSNVLLSDKTRALLEAGEYDRIRRSVKRRDYTGVGLFPKSVDPFYFLSDYVSSLKSLMPKGLDDGAILLTADARGHEDELANLIPLAQDTGYQPPSTRHQAPSTRHQAPSTRHQPPSTSPQAPATYLSGSPLHTLLATEKSKREINILGGVSIGIVILLGLFLFRSLRFIIPTVVTLAFGYAAGAIAVFVIFPGPHILTFLFGSTLIGLGVDYCYHSFSSKTPHETKKNLLAAFITTSLAFSPLFFSSVAVLNQMATFTIIGLATILAIALANNTRIASHPMHVKTPRSKWWGVIVPLALLSLFLFFVHGWAQIRVTNDPSHFYSPPKILADGEAKVAETLGGKMRFAVHSGQTLEEALQAEEKDGSAGISSILPSLKRQDENASLIDAFTGEPHQRSFITLDSLPPALRELADALMLKHNDRIYLLAPSNNQTTKPSNNQTLSLKAELEKMFARFSLETMKLTGISFAVMALALLALFRRRFLDYITPVMFAVIFTIGTLGWLGEAITFFHFLCFFVMTGVGIDYVIFHNSMSDEIKALRNGSGVVMVSFLTSLTGFGALAFSSFAPMHAMGMTLSIGLFFCYILSFPPINKYAFRHDKKRKSRRNNPSNDKTTKRIDDEAIGRSWSTQREKGATRLGILTIWWIYRLFGKTTAKIVFLIPLAFIAPFCRGIGWRKILSFAWSRMDIVDAVTLRKNTPHFTFTGDSEWMQGGAFLVASHLGSVEVLAALCDPEKPRMHAFQQISHDPIFTKFLTERMTGFTLHAVEDIDVATAIEMHDAIHRGELVLMAGDRTSAHPSRTRASSNDKTIKPSNNKTTIPQGVFRFARLMESPVYAVVAVKTGWNAYEVKSRLLHGNLIDDYADFISSEIPLHTEQWYQF